jgi:cold shock CspA family protein
MSELYIEGIVDTWISDGKNYGFIVYQDSGREKRVFFHSRSIRLDALGRRGQATVEGALVRFRIDSVLHKGAQRVVATDVNPIFAEDLPVSLDDHREVSQITRINSSKNSAWLSRSDGSEIFLHREQVLPEYFDLFQSLQVNDFVYHGVRENEPGKWGATAVELFSADEQEKLQRGESLESELAPIVATNPESVLDPSTRGKTLFDLIADKRGRDGSR